MPKRTYAKNDAFRIHPALVTVLVIVLLLTVAAVVLYPAVRDYYFSLRDNQLLEAEYVALVDRNAKIEERIEELSTPEGIADRAREELGWVLDGEEAVNITGLGETQSSTGLPPAIEAGSVQVSESWWTKSLDEFFGYVPPVYENAYSDDTIPGL